MLDAGGEELAEPVGVAPLGLSQIVVLRLLVVGQGERTSGGVVGVGELVHLAEDAALRSPVGIGKIEPSLATHLLIDSHLLLRVHDVVVAVLRTQTQGVFARIAYTCRAGLTLLRCDNDDTRHGAGTIDARSRAVFQDVERLDVVGIQTGHGRGDERLGITARQVVGRDVGDILHDDTVDDPQRLGVAVDTGGTTHANLWRCAEGAADILHRDTGGTSLERATDVGHTVELGIGSTDLGGSSGEETFVHLLHTGDDHLLQLLAAVRLEADGALLSQTADRYLLCLVAEIRNDDDIVARRSCQGVASLDVGDAALSALLQLQGSTDERFAKLVGHGATNGIRPRLGRDRQCE